MDQFRPREEQYGVKDFQRGVDDLKRFMDQYLRGRGSWIVILVIIVLYLSSGVYVVGPGEKGVVLLFGKVFSITESGLRYRLPWPIMTHTLVDVAKVRYAEIGYRSDKDRSPDKVRTRSVPAESLMLTGDENIVDVQLVVQYMVQDPIKFLFGAFEPEAALRASAEVALRGVVGENSIDYTMTRGRNEVQQKVQTYLQKLLDNYFTGLVVTQARLLVVDPPAQVKEAFHDVVRAWEDRERLIREAEGYREDILPKARGEAQQEVLAAEAFKAQRVIRAHGDAERFSKTLEEYKKAPTVTRVRLYLESAEKYLLDVRKFIMDGQNSRALPLLPLTPIQGASPAPKAPLQPQSDSPQARERE
ncbi:MAG: FtsH protease activity modulator HflK [Deltaproteobacteria bacterium]|nr:FtsH protease activity modulator HflK [Deltaproteobacteria bacterium]